MIFNVEIVNHTLPAVSVIVADRGNGVGGVSYTELKNSLGQQIYDVGCLYLYTTNDTQLSNVINYNIYDVNGNVDVTNIVTTIDPYQYVGSLLVNLKDKTNTPIILNGNSSVSTTILPNSNLQIKFLADRITNKLGQLNSNFTQMDALTGTNFFQGTYSDASDAASCSGRENLLTSQAVKKSEVIENKTTTTIQKPTNINYDILLLISIVSTSLYLYSNKDK